MGELYTRNGSIIHISATSNSLWAGKKAVFIGDSITYGHAADKSYCDFLKDYLELGSVVNLGIGGSTIASSSLDVSQDVNAICNRLETIPADADVIFLMGGVNDCVNRNQEMGEFWTYGYNQTKILTENIVTFKGALVKIGNWLCKNRPNSVVVFLTPTKYNSFMTRKSNGLNEADYAQAVRDICDLYSFNCIDTFATSGLNCSIAENKALYYSDGLHPNTAGQNLIARAIWQGMNIIPPKA